VQISKELLRFSVYELVDLVQNLNIEVIIVDNVVRSGNGLFDLLHDLNEVGLLRV